MRKTYVIAPGRERFLSWCHNHGRSPHAWNVRYVRERQSRSSKRRYPKAT